MLAGPYKDLKSYKPQEWNTIMVTGRGATAEERSGVAVWLKRAAPRAHRVSAAHSCVTHAVHSVSGDGRHRGADLVELLNVVAEGLDLGGAHCMMKVRR